MPQVRKQQYTRPIPEGATRTTMTIRRRGKDVVVPAVRVKGSDGRMMSAPVVQGGKGKDTHCRAESPFYYGTVNGKPVKLLEKKEDSERRLVDLLREAESGEGGRGFRFATQKKVALLAHIEAFVHAPAPRRSKKRKRSDLQASQLLGKLRLCLLDGCGFARLGDLDVAKVQAWLDARRLGDSPPPLPDGKETFSVAEAAEALGVGPCCLTNLARQQGVPPAGRGRKLLLSRQVVEKMAEVCPRGVSEQTQRHYCIALRSFGTWVAGPGRRMPTDPFVDLALETVKEERHARRELTIEQLRELFATTAASTRIRRKLDGKARHMLYLVAANTGFRAAGLASLTPACFRLDPDGPTVKLPVRADKSGRGKIQPLRRDIAESLRQWMADKPEGSPVWPGNWFAQGRAARMLRYDLEAAGIPYVVEGPDGPEYADFHSLRHSFLTALGRSGVDLRVQQELAGHTSSKTTERYSHVRLRDLAGAVDKLPSMMQAPPETTPPDDPAYIPLIFAADDGRGLPIVAEGGTPESATAKPKRKPNPGNGMDGGGVRLMAADESAGSGGDILQGGYSHRITI